MTWLRVAQRGRGGRAGSWGSLWWAGSSPPHALRWPGPWLLCPARGQAQASLTCKIRTCVCVQDNTEIARDNTSLFIKEIAWKGELWNRQWFLSLFSLLLTLPLGAAPPLPPGTPGSSWALPPRRPCHCHWCRGWPGRRSCVAVVGCSLLHRWHVLSTP